MPELPRIFAKTDLPTIKLPRTTPEAYGAGFFGAAATAADKVSEIFEKKKAIEDVVEASSRGAAADQGFDDLERTIRESNLSEKDIIAEWHKGAQKIQANALAGTETNRELQLRTQYLIDQRAREAYKKISGYQLQQWEGQNKAKFLEGWTEDYRKLGQLTPGTSDYNERKAIIEAKAATLDQLGFFSAEEKAKLRLDAPKREDTERLNYLMLNAPDRVANAITAGAFPTFSNAEKLEARDRADKAIREKKAMVELANKERQDDIALDYVIRLERAFQAKNLTPIYEEMLNNPNKLEVSYLRPLIDRTKALQNDLLQGNVDPWKTSDPQTRGEVQKRVWAGTITPGEIETLMGRGLSVSDTASLRKELLDLQRDKTEKPDENYKQMHKDWQDAENGGLFLPKEQRRKPKEERTAQDMLENRRVANQVLDKVRARVAKGEDPRTAFQVEMVPFWDREIGTWESILGWGATAGIVPRAWAPTTEQDRNKLNRATQRIIGRGEAVTDEAVQRELTIMPPESVGQEAKVGAIQGGMASVLPAQPESPRAASPFAAKVQAFFQQQFGRELPISAMGQSALHERWNLAHEGSMDAALNPNSIEGQALIGFLMREGIPFRAFTKAQAGAATGPHIHIGPPSPHKR